MPELNRYFLAAIPGASLYEEALKYKLYFAEKYSSRAALNSPPHVTFHMPFEWKAKTEHQLIEKLESFGTTQSPFLISYDGFGCFEPRVIYIHVHLTEEIKNFSLSLNRFCRRSLQLFNALYQDRPFHPHLTLAFRDLRKSVFPAAWNEFKEKPLVCDDRCDRFHLLRHDGKKWESIHEIPLMDAGKESLPFS